MKVFSVEFRISVLLILVQTNLIGQVYETEYPITGSDGTFLAIDKQVGIGLYLEYTLREVSFDIYSTHADTVYLIDNLFQEDIFYSTFTFQVDTFSKQIVISFIPDNPIASNKHGVSSLQKSPRFFPLHTESGGSFVLQFYSRYFLEYYPNAVYGSRDSVPQSDKSLSTRDRGCSLLQFLSYPIAFEIAYYKDVSLLMKGRSFCRAKGLLMEFENQWEDYNTLFFETNLTLAEFLRIDDSLPNTGTYSKNPTDSNTTDFATNRAIRKQIKQLHRRK